MARFYAVILSTFFILSFIITLGDTRSRRSQQHHHLVCRKETQSANRLRSRIVQAQFIFTGTVSRIYKSYSRVYRAIVKIKRIMKGERRLTDSHVIIDGFGNPQLCKSEVKEKDTRIFLVNRDSNGRLTLNSSLIRVNLNNLRRTMAAIKSK
ncbi:agrin-like protein [Dinothrombium tinctorium]|uniref:Agrin-like protein n=1 Tax=Dinothrombium tinctorium TaxID=1965070 RepID=A0A3S3NN86_9ACAR|nr:agrin-like protein [Dinothrombium tinctorium]RWS04667.1 agrin-like protein [Dinothrombium tinctorium]RWS06038.1 agrin-like protein [Dinothrombium tinctorium]RWS06042.1 agrin-like protein [Dinothrombium tinctorium]